jgi:hypothetical protein
MFRVRLSAAVLSLATIAVVTSAAEAQSITGYNITNALTPNFSGGWNWVYQGNNSNPAGPVTNYTDGHGTLNDGIIGNSTQDTELFKVSDNSVITLFLNGPSKLTSLSIFGGTLFNNVYPGAFKGATINFGGVSATLLSTGFNPVCFNGNCDDVFNFAGTAFDGLSGDVLTLSNITSGQAYYTISEITATGTPSETPSTTVPEPASLALTCLGIMSVGVVARRRGQVTAS